MKKAVIIQPMQDIPEEKIIESQKIACEYLEKKGFEVLHYNLTLIDEDTALLFEIKNQYLNIIGNFFKVMAKADAVYFTKGWALDKNCRIARLASVLYNFEIITEENE